MTNEKMNIHQALVELKTLEKRIDAAIKDGRYVVANKHSNGKIAGIPVKEYADSIMSRFHKATDLIERYNAIKRAVVNSNAVTKVEVAGKTYTVAEAIEMKNHGIERTKKLLDKLVMDYTYAQREAELSNGSDLERRADDHIKNMFGNTDIKGATEDVKRAREEFIKAQTMELVDPLDIKYMIEALREDIDTFNTTVDAALSTSNALTIIEISY